MADDGQRLGDLLMDANAITKRQLAKAIQKQIKGDKRKLGEILVELNYVTVEDLTDAMMETRHEEPIKVVTEEPSVKKEPLDISENALMKTKFKLDLKTIIAAAVGISSLVGMWYALQADIQEAKELPSLESWYKNEYPSRPEGYNWPRSYEQYKDQVGSLQEDMDEVYETIDKYEEKIETLEKTVTTLRIDLANKKDK